MQCSFVFSPSNFGRVTRPPFSIQPSSTVLFDSCRQNFCFVIFPFFILPSKLMAFIKFYLSQIHHKNPAVARSEGWRRYCKWETLFPGGEAKEKKNKTKKKRRASRETDDDATGCRARRWLVPLGGGCLLHVKSHSRPHGSQVSSREIESACKLIRGCSFLPALLGTHENQKLKKKKKNKKIQNTVMPLISMKKKM